MATNWRAMLTRYRLPILVGAGGVVAYTAYTGAQQRAAAAARATQGAPIGGLDPSQVAGLIGSGGQLVIAGQAPLVGLASHGLDAASLAAQSAAGVAEVAVGGLAAGSMTLADVIAQLVGGFVPAPIAPAPVPIPIAPAPVPIPMPIPPIGPAPIVDSFVQYTVIVSGKIDQAAIVSAAGTILSYRTLYFIEAPGTSGAPVTKGQTTALRWWETAAGGFKGISYVSGVTSGAWSIHSVWRRPDGSTYQRPEAK